MNLRMIILLLLFSTGVLSAQRSVKKGVVPVKPHIEDKLRPAGKVVIGGFTGERLDASYQNRILVQDVDRLVAPFLNHTETSCWQSEFWGKWITSAILAYRYRPEANLKEVLDKAVTGLIAAQSPDGYIGNYRDDRRLESWDIWGRKYCMLGLLAYYDITGDARSLQSAVKLADHLMQELSNKNVTIVSKGNHKGMAATSILEPVCLLYIRTGDKRYLDFAGEIVRQWETPEGPQLITKSEVDVAKRFPKPESWYGPGQGQKAYEMMSCYEGLLELYRLTGNQVFKTAVEKTWQNIIDTEINITGSGSSAECWFGGGQLQVTPVYHYQETCVTATWIKLSQQLLRLTGEAKYADAIEQSYYNALLGAMTHDGSDWAKYTPLSGERREGSEQCGMGLNCCNASGPRGLFTLPLTTAMSSEGGIQVNFFTEGSIELQTPGKQRAELTLNTSYPLTGKVAIRLTLPAAEQMDVGIRIPAWSKETVLSVNGEPAMNPPAGQVAVINRSWQSGDVVTLELDMRGRVVRMGQLPGHVAIVRGPVVLARDARLQGPAINSVLAPLVGKDGFVELEMVESKESSIWMQFRGLAVTESYREQAAQPLPVIFCDYASAGNTISGDSHFRVWYTQLVNPRLLPD